MHDHLDPLFKEQEWLYRLARRMSRDDNAARDLVQETWVVALSNPPANAHRPQRWLQAVTKRIAASRNARRSSHPVEDITEFELNTREPQPESVAVRLEAGEALQKAVASLDPVDQEPVRLHHEYGLSLKEVARALKITPRTVRRRLSKSYELIKQKLGGEKSARDGSWAVSIAPLLAPGRQARSGGVAAIGSGAFVAGIAVTFFAVVGGAALLGPGRDSPGPRDDDRLASVLPEAPRSEAHDGGPSAPPRERQAIEVPPIDERTEPATDEPQRQDDPDALTFHVSGVILIDGAVPEEFEVTLLYAGPTYVEWNDAQKMAVRDDGTFDVWAPEPGDWRLHLKKPGASTVDGHPHFTKAVQFSATTTEFAVRVVIPETRTVTVIAERHERVSLKRPEEPTDEWRYGSSCAVVDGKATFLQVPVGRIQVLSKDNEQVLHDGWVEADGANVTRIE